MTVLMSSYADDGADVILISDRKSVPNAGSIAAKEGVYKTLRLWMLRPWCSTVLAIAGRARLE